MVTSDLAMLLVHTISLAKQSWCPENALKYCAHVGTGQLIIIAKCVYTP